MRARHSLLLALLTLSAPAAAAAGELDGSWSGGGYVIPKESPKESVQCRVTYTQHSSKVYAVKATCATASVKINQTGEVLDVGGGRYVGDFYNPDYDVSGRIRVTVSGSRQTVTFSGAQGHGSMTLSKR